MSGRVKEGLLRLEVQVSDRELDRLRCKWLNPEGTSEAELKKRTLTNLYNAPLNPHARLDRAVSAAHGGPSDISDEAILKSLLALNLERSGQVTRVGS